MLQSRSFLISLRTQALASIQRLHTSFELRKSSSSSSDSDSDSDTNAARSKKQTKEVKSSNKNVQDLKLSSKNVEDVKLSGKTIQDLRSSNKNVQDVKSSNKNEQDLKSSNKNVQDVKSSKENAQDAKGAFAKPQIQSKFQPYVVRREKKRWQEPTAKNKLPPKETYNKKLQDAANAVAAQGKREKQEQIASDLLNKTTQIDKEKTAQYSATISDLISKMKVEKTVSTTDELDEKLKFVRRTTMSKRAGNIRPMERIVKQPKSLHDGEPLGIFPQQFKISSNVPEMSTWDMLYQRELNAALVQPPRNALQEMILWTKQGKLWKFPIDNEQGMEEEQNVHFSEHIFMERHLKGWCPTRGPVRHFMELVCVGLSKNPYLTVQEKVEHIMWFKDYFEEHKDLLQEIGAVEKAQSPKQVTT